jgi:hypothetical protein
MAEQGLGATFHFLEVPQQGVGSDTFFRPPQGMECNNTSPKTIEDYMRKSARFSYGRTRSWCNIPFLGGASIRCRLRHLVEPTSGHGRQQHKSKNH